MRGARRRIGAGVQMGQGRFAQAALRLGQARVEILAALALDTLDLRAIAQKNAPAVLRGRNRPQLRRAGPDLASQPGAGPGLGRGLDLARPGAEPEPRRGDGRISLAHDRPSSTKQDLKARVLEGLTLRWWTIRREGR